jgi:hypothetical protein
MMLFACISIIAGCQSFGQAVGSKKIQTRHLLMIPKQGSVHIRWEAKHITIEFKGKVNQKTLTMEGQLGIAGGGIQHFATLDRLVVDIYLSTPDGSVLDRHKFYSTVKSPVDNMVPRMFKRSYELPKGTTHIAFGYDGKARDGGSNVPKNRGDAIEHGFQHSPFR